MDITAWFQWLLRFLALSRHILWRFRRAAGHKAQMGVKCLSSRGSGCLWVSKVQEENCSHQHVKACHGLGQPYLQFIVNVEGEIVTIRMAPVVDDISILFLADFMYHSIIRWSSRSGPERERYTNPCSQGTDKPQHLLDSYTSRCTTTTHVDMCEWAYVKALVGCVAQFPLSSRVAEWNIGIFCLLSMEALKPITVSLSSRSAQNLVNWASNK